MTTAEARSCSAATRLTRSMTSRWPDVDAVVGADRHRAGAAGRAVAGVVEDLHSPCRLRGRFGSVDRVEPDRLAATTSRRQAFGRRVRSVGRSGPRPVDGEQVAARDRSPARARHPPTPSAGPLEDPAVAAPRRPDSASRRPRSSQGSEAAGGMTSARTAPPAGWPSPRPRSDRGPAQPAQVGAAAEGRAQIGGQHPDVGARRSSPPAPPAPGQAPDHPSGPGADCRSERRPTGRSARARSPDPGGPLDLDALPGQLVSRRPPDLDGRHHRRAPARWCR